MIVDSKMFEGGTPELNIIQHAKPAQHSLAKQKRHVSLHDRSPDEEASVLNLYHDSGCERRSEES